VRQNRAIKSHVWHRSKSRVRSVNCYKIQYFWPTCFRKIVYKPQRRLHKSQHVSDITKINVSRNPKRLLIAIQNALTAENTWKYHSMYRPMVSREVNVYFPIHSVHALVCRRCCGLYGLFGNIFQYKILHFVAINNRPGEHAVLTCENGWRYTLIFRYTVYMLQFVDNFCKNFLPENTAFCCLDHMSRSMWICNRLHASVSSVGPSPTASLAVARFHWQPASRSPALADAYPHFNYGVKKTSLAYRPPLTVDSVWISITYLLWRRIFNFGHAQLSRV